MRRDTFRRERKREKEASKEDYPGGGEGKDGCDRRTRESEGLCSQFIVKEFNTLIYILSDEKAWAERLDPRSKHHTCT